MPEKKRQHTVPQMYQRNFANDKENVYIGVYHLASGKYIDSTKIETQAYDNYFYGKDGNVEDYLAEIESYTNLILNRIIKSNELPVINSKEHMLLALFIATLGTRTTHAVESMEEMIRKSIKEFSSNSEQERRMMMDFEEEKKQDGMEARGAMSLRMGVESAILLSDMKIKILVSDNKQFFFTSDNPVVMYNMFMENKKNVGSSVGYALVGLQIFLPLNSNKCLILYDDKIYNIGKKVSDVVSINEVDVRNINKLTLLNSNDILLFNSIITKEYVDNLILECKYYKRDEKTDVVAYSQEKQDSENKAKLLRMSRKDIRIGLTLSYGFITKFAGTLKADNRILVRNKELVESLDGDRGYSDGNIFIDELKKNFKEEKK